MHQLWIKWQRVFILVHVHKLSINLHVFWHQTFWRSRARTSYRSGYSFWKQTCLWNKQNKQILFIYTIFKLQILLVLFIY